MAESIFMARLNTDVDVIKDPFKRQGVIDAILVGYDSAKTEGDKLYYSNLAAHVYATAAADTFNIDQTEFQKFKALEDAALNADLLGQVANIPSTLGEMAIELAENYAQTTKARAKAFSSDPAMTMLTQYMQPALHLASRHVLDPKRDDISGTLEALSNVFATPVNVTQHVQGVYTDTEREQLFLIYKQPTPDARLDSLQRWRAGDVADVANFALLASAVARVELPLTPPPSNWADSWTNGKFNQLAATGVADIEMSTVNPADKPNFASNVMQMTSDGGGDNVSKLTGQGKLGITLEEIITLAAREDDIDNVLLLRNALVKVNREVFFETNGKVGMRELLDSRFRTIEIPDFEAKFADYLESIKETRKNLTYHESELRYGLDVLSDPNKSYALNFGALKRANAMLAGESVDATSVLANNALENEIGLMQKLPVNSIHYHKVSQRIEMTIDDMVKKHPQLKEVGNQITAKIDYAAQNPDLIAESAKSRWYLAHANEELLKRDYGVVNAYSEGVPSNFVNQMLNQMDTTSNNYSAGGENFAFFAPARSNVDSAVDNQLMEALSSNYYRAPESDFPLLLRSVKPDEVTHEMMQQNLDAMKLHYAELMSQKPLTVAAETHQDEYINLFKTLAKPFSEDALAGKDVPELIEKWQTAISASQGQDYESVRGAVHNIYDKFRNEGGWMVEEEFNALNATSSYDGLVKAGRIQNELIDTQLGKDGSIVIEPPDNSL